jgi:hypothetical protein
MTLGGYVSKSSASLTGKPCEAPVGKAGASLTRTHINSTATNDPAGEHGALFRRAYSGASNLLVVLRLQARRPIAPTHSF